MASFNTVATVKCVDGREHRRQWALRCVLRYRIAGDTQPGSCGHPLPQGRAVRRQRAVPGVARGAAAEHRQWNNVTGLQLFDTVKEVEGLLAPTHAEDDKARLSLDIVGLHAEEST